MADFRSSILLLLAIHTHSIVCVSWGHIRCATDTIEEMPDGTVPNIGRFPWLGIVQHSFYIGGKVHFAVTGAVLIHPAFAIASAEDISKIDPDHLTNNTKLILWGGNKEKFVVEVKDYILHPEYHDKVTFATIALLDLIAWGDSQISNWRAPVLPICMPTRGAGSFENLYAVKMTDVYGTMDKEVFKMKYVENQDCEEFYYKAQLTYSKMNPVNPLCAISEFAEKPCVWDSGTVLTTRESWGFWKLLGFAIRGPGCGAPTRFLNMHDYLPWINDIITQIPYEESDKLYKIGMRRVSPVEIVLYKPHVFIPTKQGQCERGQRGNILYKDSAEITVNKNFAQGFFYVEIHMMASFTCAIVSLEVSRQSNAAVWIEHNCHRDAMGLHTGFKRPSRERVYPQNFELRIFSIVATMLLVTFLVVSVVAAKEYTDEDRANFPKLFHLDEYERCLARVDGVYCLGTFDLTPAKQPHPAYELMKAYTDESYRHFNRTRIHRGYCLSMRCPTLATWDNASLVFEPNKPHFFERCVDHFAKVRELRASLHTLHYCRTHADSITVQPPTTAEQIFKKVIYALVVANIIGTIYDAYYGDTPYKNKILSAFSIPANWRRLTFIRGDGDPRQAALVPMEGVRVMALGFTTYAHASVFHYMFHTINPEFLEQMTQRIDGVFMADGTSLIQAFVMMSCFLTGYNLLIFSQKHDLSIHMLPLCIIKRFIRMTPVHLLIVGYGATWWLNSRDGPLVSTTIGLESEACKTKFWSHVFLVNNIVDSNNYCVVPTWFLAVNMHMYILACTFTLLLWRRRSFAVRLYAVLFIASCLVTAVVAYAKDYKAMVYIATPEHIRRIFRDTPSFTNFYISSWGALPSCFVGLILAHILFELDERKIKLSDYKWFVYLHYTCFPLLFMWSLTGMYVRGQNSALFNAAYIALDRPFYCILVVIFLLGLFHIDGPLKRFYGWQGWRSMARMSLTVMMLHWCINMTIGNRPIAYKTSILDILVDWSATKLITYAVAVPITILVEYPMQKFLEALLF